MVPRPRRKGKDAQLSQALRAVVETMWSIASTLTGDDAAEEGDESTAVEVVREVTRRTLPQGGRYRHRGLKLEIVIATTEAGATRVFSPRTRRNRGGAHAAPHNPQAAALRRAFSRRLSWDVQALLWATEVEDIAEADVARRLGEIDLQAGRVAVRLAYLDLRRDLDDRCRATLTSSFGSCDPEPSFARDSHLHSCALCQAEICWLTDLGSALSTLPSPMPAAVWEGARRFAAGDDRAFVSLGQNEATSSGAAILTELGSVREASSGGADIELPVEASAEEDGAEEDSAQRDSAEEDSAEEDSAEEDSAEEDSAEEDSAEEDSAERDSTKGTAGVTTTATNGHAHGPARPTVDAQKLRNRALHR